jgi:hypothetical protein
MFRMNGADDGTKTRVSNLSLALARCPRCSTSKGVTVGRLAQDRNRSAGPGIRHRLCHHNRLLERFGRMIENRSTSSFGNGDGCSANSCMQGRRARARGNMRQKAWYHRSREKSLRFLRGIQQCLGACCVGQRTTLCAELHSRSDLRCD